MLPAQEKKEKRFFHLMHDDKFFDAVVDLFLAFPSIENIFIAGVDRDHYKVKYIKSDLIQVMRYDSPEYKSIMDNVQSDDVVVVHYLDRQKSLVINSILTRPAILWLSFGAELYSSIYYPHELHLHLTKLLLAVNPKYQARKIRDFVKSLVSIYLPGDRKTAIENAFARIDYFATPLSSEIALFRQYLPGLIAKEVFFQYGSLESTLGSAVDFTGSLGNGVFVGNSNTPASNHADAFSFIHRLDGKNREIIVPLSYGGDPVYRQSILLLGKRYFGKHFQPLVKFLNKSAYTSKMSLCYTAVFMHIRQQAIGNILIALFLGLKVFLLRENPCYGYFVSIGVFVYAIEDCTGHEFASALSYDRKKANKEILINIFGEKAVLNNMKDTIQIVSGRIK
jgi:dTDP-N-acetylfucosamine:lipid II N-acetylfucosaminyltransferase